MRTYEEQAGAVKKRIDAHNLKRHKMVKALYATTSVCIIAAVSAVMSLTLGNKTKRDAGYSAIADTEECIIEDSATSYDYWQNDYTGATAHTDFEVITGTEFYGRITQSHRSESELKKLTGRDSDIITAYEDERYIYFFYTDGTLHSILNMSEAYTEQYLEADSKSIKKYAETIIRKYLTNFNSGDYAAEVEHSENALPAWSITYTKKSGGITVEKIIIRFASNGDMYYLRRETSLSNVNINLSYEKAAVIALDSLNEKHGLDISDAESKYDISVFIVPEEDDTFYSVEIGGIPVKYGRLETEKCYLVKVSALTGAVLNISESR